MLSLQTGEDNTGTTKERLRITGSGDIVFYNDAATTQALYWDSSAEFLGIGTTSPNAPLEATKAITFSNVDTIGQFLIKSAAGSTGDMLNFGVDSTNSLAFIQANEKGTDTIPLVLQRYGGNLGIGTTSPSTPLHVSAASPELRLQDSDDNGYLALNHNGANSYVSTTQGGILFRTGGTTERMRIDSSGNLGIGTTSPASVLTYSGSFDATSAGSKPSLTGAGSYGGGIGFVDTNVSGMYTDGSGANLRLFTNQSGSDRADAKIGLSIDGSQNVGIGTTSPAKELEVVGTIKTTGADNNNGLEVFGGTTTGQSFGLLVDAGTNASDYAARFRKSDDTIIMEVSGDGKVGIGTSSPARELHLSATTPRFRLEDSDGGYSEISGSGGHLTLSADGGASQSASRMAFEVDGAEKARIDSSGNLGLGTSSPSTKLNVVESSAATAATFKVDDNSAQVANVVVSNDADTGLNLGVFGSSAGTAGMISASDAFITTSTTELNVGVNN
jgi:hypothetical protein